MSEKSGFLWDEAIDRCKTFMDASGVTRDHGNLLLAVSGGMDSMCMLYLMAEIRTDFGVAHVNYGLRAEASDADAALVRETCRDMVITLHERQLDLNTLKQPGDESLQQFGRRIRYQWFEELCEAHHYDFVCTAHHQDDAAETFFINLVRGTGLKGLTGIPIVRGRVVRPMLCFTRAEIEVLVQEKQIPYRDDESNFGKDYLRNRIRHDVIPWFQKERAGFISRMYATQHRLSEECTLLEDYLQNLHQRICRDDQGVLVIDRTKLLETAVPSVVLQYILRRFGFSWDQCRKIVSGSYSSGARFLTSSFQLVVDRGHFYVTAVTNEATSIAFRLPGEGEFVVPGGALRISKVAGSPEFEMNRQIEYVDGDLLSDTLLLRHWQTGDLIYPIHGPGKQKLQDFFTNEKVPVPDKEQIWLLLSGDEIVWVVGMRLDHRFRVTSETQNIMRLEWKRSV